MSTRRTQPVTIVLSLLLAFFTMAPSEATNSTPPEWTVLYHGVTMCEVPVKGRGEFLRLMLEDKGVSYVNSDDGLYGPNGMMDAFRGSPAAVRNDETDSNVAFPLFFPPAIWHRPTARTGEEDVLVNQVGACMIYLGDILGYTPATAAERAKANAIMLNALDYIAEGRLSFHPVNHSASYNDQKEDGDRVSKEFSQVRMKTFLYHFQKVVLTNGSRKPVAGGSDVTYADFALFHVLDATAFQFQEEWDKTEVVSLKEYYAWMKARPNLAAYFQTDRCFAWAGDSMM